MKILLTGSQGFIGPYLCEKFLNNNHSVIGIDNLQKYGYIPRQHDEHKNFQFYNINIAENDLKDIFFKEQPDVIIANAAIIGGLEYINNNLYTLYSNNEKILMNTLDATIQLNDIKKVKRFVFMSSSYVFQNVDKILFKEADLLDCTPPSSIYAFQKLSGEYLVKAAHEQHKIPYTIIRPFNCIGKGEETQKENTFNNHIKSSHVVPDLIKKIKSNQNPLQIWGSGEQVRCFTHCEDIAQAILLAINSDNAINEDFNISSEEPISILDLSKLIWDKINTNIPYSYVLQKSLKDDVLIRIPDVSKAKDLLNFQCSKKLLTSIDEIIDNIEI